MFVAHLSILSICLILSSTWLTAGDPFTIKAIYGVNVSQVDKINQTVKKLKEAGVNSAFVTRDKRLIDALHKNGLQAFFSINAFGGVGPWKSVSGTSSHNPYR